MVFKVSWSQHPFALLFYVTDGNAIFFDRSNTQSTYHHGLFRARHEGGGGGGGGHPTKKKESSSSSTTTTGSEGGRGGRVHLERASDVGTHEEHDFVDPSSSSSSSTTTTTMPLKTLNVPSMKTREADVLVLEEKVSRVTNELNAAIREKGVAKSLEEVSAEMLWHRRV